MGCNDSAMGGLLIVDLILLIGMPILGLNLARRGLLPGTRRK